jgi:hypothetical protein
MPGILDPSYGALEERRSRSVKKILVWGFLALIAGGTLFVVFRNYREERAMKQFIAYLDKQQYQDAYKLMAPSKYYPPEKFLEDFGPAGMYKDLSHASIQHEDVCSGGVVFNVVPAKGEAWGLIVNSDTQQISFYSEPRCPGKHWQIWEFLKARFS